MRRERFEIGSMTAKGGFANEKAICQKFNNWGEDPEARLWLKIMGYELALIDAVEAVHIPLRIKQEDMRKLDIEGPYDELLKFKKADAQVRVTIKIGNLVKIENISLKKANSNADYNQVDKRCVDAYKEMWGFDEEIAIALKLFTGELKPVSYPELTQGKALRDPRRMFLDELPKDLTEKLINFFKENRILVVSDVLKGRGGLSANWMLVTRYNKENDATSWILKDINTAMNFFGSGEVALSPRGSLRIGRIIMQRKGGTPDPTKLQFKIRPCELFLIG